MGELIRGKSGILLILPLAAAVLVNSACRKGPGIERLAADVDNHDFLLDMGNNRVIFISGAYPRKSYLCFQALSGGAHRSFHWEGYSLTGRPFILRDGRTVLIAATHHGEQFMEDNSSQALLRVDLETGEILRSYGLADGTIIRAVSEPRWSPAPVLALQDPGSIRLVRLDSRADLKTGGAKLDASVAGEIAIADDYPTVAAVAAEQTGAGALRLFDARSGKHGRQVGLQNPKHLIAQGNGRWLVTVEDANGGAELVELNDTLQKINPRLTASGRIESVAIGKRWLYAVSWAQQSLASAGKSWIHERELHRIDLTAVEPARTFPWTKLEGALLGLDEGEGRLYYAVTDKDKTATWSLPTDAGILEKAAAEIEGSRRISLGLIGQISILLTVLFLIGSMIYFVTSQTGI